MIKLVAFDLDGTLTQHKTTISDENRAVLDRLAEKYIQKASRSGSLFEVNTGAISRGYRTTPYPHINLLRTLKKEGAGLVLCSDSHAADTLDCFFKESRLILKDVGFEYVYTLYNGEFVKDML